MKNDAKDSNIVTRNINGVERRFAEVKTPITTIPFVKTHEFNYSKIISWIGAGADKYTWIVYIIVVTFIITAVSNGANITDGLDGLGGRRKCHYRCGFGHLRFCKWQLCAC